MGFTELHHMPAINLHTHVHKRVHTHAHTHTDNKGLLISGSGSSQIHFSKSEIKKDRKTLQWG